MMANYVETLAWVAEVMAATGCSEDDAILALLDTGSIKEAIAQVIGNA